MQMMVRMTMKMAIKIMNKNPVENSFERDGDGGENDQDIILIE